MTNKGLVKMVNPKMESALNKVVKSGDCVVKTEQDNCLDSRPMKYRAGQRMILISPTDYISAI